jgi:hypothetical protein
MIPGSAIPLLLATAGPTLDPRLYFDVKLYTGNGSTQTISGLNFSPDFVWIKERGLSGGHVLYDTIRGATNSLSTQATLFEQTDTDALTAFTSMDLHSAVGIQLSALMALDVLMSPGPGTPAAQPSPTHKAASLVR